MSRHAPIPEATIIRGARRRMLRAWDAAVAEWKSTLPRRHCPSGPAQREWRLYAGTHLTTPGATGLGG